jgi:hypothetical protein
MDDGRDTPKNADTSKNADPERKYRSLHFDESENGRTSPTPTRRDEENAPSQKPAWHAAKQPPKE